MSNDTTGATGLPAHIKTSHSIYGVTYLIGTEIGNRAVEAWAWTSDDLRAIAADIDRHDKHIHDMAVSLMPDDCRAPSDAAAAEQPAATTPAADGAGADGLACMARHFADHVGTIGNSDMAALLRKMADALAAAPAVPATTGDKT